jgi:hypothetical protein
VNDYSIAFIVSIVVLGIIALPIVIDQMIRRATASPRFNSTADWTPAPPVPGRRLPAGDPYVAYDPDIIKPHLGSGETLEGFGRGFFRPPRPQDWKYGPQLLIAVTSNRILLFEMKRLTVLRYCFIPFDDLRYVNPPQGGRVGSTGIARIGLRSGMEYQMDFRSPLLSEQAMFQERRLAAYFKRLALRNGEMENAA